MPLKIRKGRCVLETVVARLSRAYAGSSADLILLRAREERQWLVRYVAKEISAVVVPGVWAKNHGSLTGSL
jgi:hypothetical protein